MDEYHALMRKARGKKIAEAHRVINTEEGFTVLADNARTKGYPVKSGANGWSCACPDYKQTGEHCKHIYAVQYHHYGRVDEPEPPPGMPLRKTYPQNWHAYNAAQSREAHDFMPLLYDLCQMIPERERRRGRRPIPYSDAVFAAVSKVYSTKSTRRAVPMLDLAYDNDFLSRPISFTSIWSYMEKPELTPLLRQLIIASSRPLALVETIFGVDATVFPTSRFVKTSTDRDYRGQQEHGWLRVHLMCGVKTNIITDAVIEDRKSDKDKKGTALRQGEGPMLPTLLNTTAETFRVQQVLADGAYNSVENYHAIDAVGAVGYIPFHSGHTGSSSPLYKKMLDYFVYQQQEFRKYYHMRSNIESANTMVKAGWGNFVRSKTDTAQANEVLCKIVCHNICCLIHALYELEIAAELLPGAFYKRDAAD